MPPTHPTEVQLRRKEGGGPEAPLNSTICPGYEVTLIELFVVELLEPLDICSAAVSCW